MSRRNRIRHAVKRLSIGAALQLPTSASTTIVFCQHGSLDCAVDGASVRLDAEDCVVVEGGTAALHLSATEPATIIVIEMFPHAATVSVAG